MSEIQENSILDNLLLSYIKTPVTKYLERGKGFIVFEEDGRKFKIQIKEVKKKTKK